MIRKICIYILPYLFYPFACPVFAQEVSFSSLLEELDRVIDENKSYILKKEARIEMLNNRKGVLSADSKSSYDIHMQLYEEYKAYQCDSAIVYLNRCIGIAEALRDNVYLTESRLLLAALLEKSGLYKEATDVIESVDRRLIPDHLLKMYYNVYYGIYRSIEFHSQNDRLRDGYRMIAQVYRDSLLSVHDEGLTDEMSLAIQEGFYLDNGYYDKALAINDIRLQRVKPGTADHALVSYFRSYIGLMQGDYSMQKHYLCVSAISDIKAGIKDYASLWMLAEILYNEGDIDRAYRYIYFSWDDARFYNARHRNLQTAGILSLIDETYQQEIHERNKRLWFFILLITFLSVLLGSALLYIYLQMKRLSMTRQDLQVVNGQLQHLNEELSVMNHDLQMSNDSLSESNLIKEKYIWQFIHLCSVYIDKLDAHRQSVHKKIVSGQIEQLKQMTDSSDYLESELKELYMNFDTVFLQLFPDFVDRFNELLLDEERIKLKKGELLNTELRIYALIRLGINESGYIAEFLRYSLSTIYNYRTKMRNKAKVSRDDFESLVKQIK